MKQIQTGEVIRTEEDLDSIDIRFSHNDAIQVNPLNTLIINECHYQGMVGESIVIYTYFLVSFNTGKPVVTSIKSIEDFKTEVYKIAQGKQLRIRLWLIMKNQDEFHGWSEDPRPYVE